MKNKGFTLIEILVVVLIIGVLVVIALPQYNRAVEKARYTEAEETLHSIYQAQHGYYISHGRYSEDFSGLDLDFPNVSGNRGTGAVLSTQNFEISLEDVNEANTLAKANRKKGEVTSYSLYKNLDTGQLLCEDFDKTDSITCSSLGFGSEVYTCGDGSISNNGSGGCSDQEELSTPGDPIYNDLYTCPDGTQVHGGPEKCPDTTIDEPIVEEPIYNYLYTCPDGKKVVGGPEACPK